MFIDILDPNYVGCFIDNSNRDLDGYLVDLALTIEQCIKICTGLNFLYAGLQHRYIVAIFYFFRTKTYIFIWVKSSFCLCGNEYGRYGKVEDAECSYDCSGNTNQKCGAFWRNSVYRTGAQSKNRLLFIYFFYFMRNRYII